MDRHKVAGFKPTHVGHAHRAKLAHRKRDGLKTRQFIWPSGCGPRTEHEERPFGPLSQASSDAA